MDVNLGKPCRHIQCVLGGCFKKQQFNDHWLRATDVDMCDRFCVDISPASSRENIDVLMTVDDSLQTIGEIFGEKDIPHVTQLTQDCNTLGEDEGNPDDIIQATSTSMHSHHKKKSKKLPSSTDKYNNIRAEGEHLANIASSDSHEQYNKLLTLLRYVRANLQNKSGEELKAAAASYLNISNLDPDSEIFPSSRMRTEGRMSTKRKKSSVESATIGAVKKCGFCKSIGHNKQSCPIASGHGKRLTKGIFELIDTVQNSMDIIGYDQIDSIVPSDAMGLHISEKHVIADKSFFKARVLLIGLRIKLGRDCWFARSTIDEWCRGGASSVHYVFLKH